jgi:FlaA1/EpsC-like NDP-sugar epimerase
MSKSNLLIFGATGAIGSYITAAIIDARDAFGRIGIFTSQSTLTNKTKEINTLREKGVDILVGDVTSKHEVLNAFDGTLWSTLYKLWVSGWYRRMS